MPRTSVTPNSEKLPEKQVSFAPKPKPPKPVTSTGEGERRTGPVLPWFQKRSG